MPRRFSRKKWPRHCSNSSSCCNSAVAAADACVSAEGDSATFSGAITAISYIRPRLQAGRFFAGAQTRVTHSRVRQSYSQSKSKPAKDGRERESEVNLCSRFLRRRQQVNFCSPGGTRKHSSFLPSCLCLSFTLPPLRHRCGVSKCGHCCRFNEAETGATHTRTGCISCAPPQVRG